MFKTLDDLKDKNKKENKNTTSYAGGTSSGMAIENPADINEIVQKASQSQPISAEEAKDGNTCTITLWQNGFQVNNGEFRDYNGPANQQFMKELNEGVVPTELRAKYPKGLSVSLEDKRKQAYRPPTPPKYVEFSGQGTSLGGQTVKQEKIQKNQSFQYDPSQPHGDINIRLHNGEIVTITTNLTQTVQQVANYINLIAPANFVIIAGFPPKQVTNYSQTVEIADFINSRITQKLK